MKTYSVNNYAVEGKIKLAVKFSKLQEIMNAPEGASINVDKAVKKLLKNAGIDCIECDLRRAASGSWVSWYRKERKGKWYDWSELDKKDKERINNGQK